MAPRKKSSKALPKAKKSTTAQKKEHIEETLRRVNEPPRREGEGRIRAKRVFFGDEIADDEGADDNDNEPPSTPSAKAPKATKKPPLILTFKNISTTAMSTSNTSKEKEVIPIPSSPAAPIYEVSVSLSLLINGKPKATPSFDKVSRDSLSLDAVWSAFEPHYKKETEPIEPISQTIICTLRCISKSVRRQVHIIDDWSMASCQVLLNIMDDKFAEKQSNFELAIEFKVDINIQERNKLLKATAMSSLALHAYEEPTTLQIGDDWSKRAIQIGLKHNQKIAAAAEIGGNIQRLRKTYRCDAGYCLNRGNYCYPERPPSREHWWLTDQDFEKWAKGIEVGITDFDGPQEALFKHWVMHKKTGDVRDVERQSYRLTSRELLSSVNSFQSSMSSGFDKLMELQVKLMEQHMMAEQKADEAESRRQRERDRKRRIREEEEEDREEAERSLLRRHRKKEMVILPSSSPCQVTRTRDRRKVSPSARVSSPITCDQDDMDIIRDLFDWRKIKVEDERSVERLTESYLKVVENQFSIAHLKAMSDGKGVFFEAGKAAGLPLGLMMQFRGFFKEYKEKVVKESNES